MVNVYYVKMNDPNQVKNYEFIDPNPQNFPELQKGDLCFVRLAGESSPSALKRLWVFDRFEDEADGSRTAKFTPHWKDAAGNEVWFNALQLKTEFIALNWFEFNLTMTNYINKQRKNKSFFPLKVVKQQEFVDALKTVGNFNRYVGDKNNYRKVEVVQTIQDFDPNAENIQLCKDANGVYSLN